MYRYETFEEYETELVVLEYTIQEAKEAFDALREENRYLANKVEELEQHLRNLGVTVF